VCPVPPIGTPGGLPLQASPRGLHFSVGWQWACRWRGATRKSLASWGLELLSGTVLPSAPMGGPPSATLSMRRGE